MSDIHDLVRAIIQRQKELGETDLDFSRRLGVSRQTWQLTRTGGMLPGRRTLEGIAQAFPDLNLMAFLSPSNASILTDTASKMASEAAR